MEKALDVLLVSCRLENRRTLFGVLQDLPVNAHTVFTCAKAKEFIAANPVDMVFCEEELPDGSYHEVLAELHSVRPSAQFVLLLCNGEWNEYLEALQLGIEEILRPPLLSMDVDLVLIHSARKHSGTNLSSLMVATTPNHTAF